MQVRLHDDRGRIPEDTAVERGAVFLRIGYWSALVCGIGAVAYGVASILVGVFAAPAITWEGYEHFVAEYSPIPTLLVVMPPFVVAVVFPILMLAISTIASAERRPFALLGFLFAGIYTAVLGAAYWLQLTNVPWNIGRGTSDGVAPWVLWNPSSFFWSLETFGYFAMGLWCLFAGLAFEAGGLPRRLRRGLIAMGALGVYFMIVAFKDLAISMAFGEPWPSGLEALATAMALSAAFAWVLLFGFVAFSLARWFARLRPMGSLTSPHITAGASRED